MCEKRPSGKKQGNYFLIEYNAFKNYHFPVKEGEYLIDVLPHKWYTGEDPAHPGGHIPGAINIPVEKFATSKGEPINEGKALKEVVSDLNATVICSENEFFMYLKEGLRQIRK
jgi:3-mercaptopyruvate sulfurtransferase SseA